MNTDIDIVDFMDLLNFTLHKDFVDKWRYKYSEKFIKHFQIKLLESLNKGKVLKRSSLFNYLTKKCRYSGDQVENFFISIDLSIYSPIIVNDKPRQKRTLWIHNRCVDCGFFPNPNSIHSGPMGPVFFRSGSVSFSSVRSWSSWHPLGIGCALRTVALG